MINKEPAREAGRVGLYIPAYDGADYTYPTYYSHPFEWAGSNYFRSNGAIMLNAPWMDSTYLPIGPKPALLTDRVNFAYLQEPIEFRKKLIHDRDLQALVFPQVDFILFTDQDHWATEASLNEILDLDPADRWACHRNNWYILCDKEHRG